MHPTWKTMVAVITVCVILCGFAFKVGAWVERVDTSDKSNEAVNTMNLKMGDIDTRLSRVENEVHLLLSRSDPHEKSVASIQEK